MTDTIILCKEGTINSYLSALVVATNRSKAGEDIAVVFMQEGLAALIDKKFRYDPGLEKLELQDLLAELGKVKKVITL